MRKRLLGCNFWMNVLWSSCAVAQDYSYPLQKRKHRGPMSSFLHHCPSRDVSVIQMSSTALHILELVKSLPSDEQRLVCAWLNRRLAGMSVIKRPTRSDPGRPVVHFYYMHRRDLLKSRTGSNSRSPSPQPFVLCVRPSGFGPQWLPTPRRIDPPRHARSAHDPPRRAWDRRVHRRSFRR